jgi:hypothetical protein
MNDELEWSSRLAEGVCNECMRRQIMSASSPGYEGKVKMYAEVDSDVAMEYIKTLHLFIDRCPAPDNEFQWSNSSLLDRGWKDFMDKNCGTKHLEKDERAPSA